MAAASDAVADAFGLQSDKGESMDVLLQLTLPIVLILAFVIATDIRSLEESADAMTQEYQDLATQNHDLRQQMLFLTKELDGSDSGRLLDQLDLALLTLQQQLLIKTSDAVIAEQRRTLGIDNYAATLPTIADLLSADIDAGFAATTRHLAQHFNGAKQRALTFHRLRAEIVERFQQNVDELLNHGRIPLVKRQRLRTIDTQSRELLSSHLNGKIENLLRSASEVQLGLVLSWVSSREAERVVEKQATPLWRAIQGAGDERTRKRNVDDFVNLKTRALLSQLRKLELPLLEQTCHSVFEQSCDS